MAPHISKMRENIAEVLGLEADQVNIKATTEEGLGFTGTGEGISSQAICAIEKITNLSTYKVGDSEMGCANCSGCRRG
jgi:2-C-methyl-D-erythritol 2,4-cyclodiphosphate synthase